VTGAAGSAVTATAGQQRGSWPLLAAEGAAIALVVGLDALDYVPVSKTPLLLLIGWVSLRLRGARWQDVGFRRGPDLRRLAYLAVMGGIALETFQLTITQPLVVRAFGAQPDLQPFTSLAGNLPRAAIGLLFVWVIAAFGEELVWRGYVFNRIAGLVVRWRAPYSIALGITSLLFGLAHFHQGPPGVVIEGVGGMILGAAYLGCDRNLAVPIAVHGVVDTIDVVLGYLGQLPGS
jgi:membrane protease YdiL (CAAX protease family)